MGRYQADWIVLASIYPGVLPRIRKNFGDSPEHSKGRSKVFWIPPVGRSEPPQTLQVYDMFASSLDPLRTQGTSKHQWSTELVVCSEIVDNLLNEWTGSIFGAPPGSGPGVGIIANTVPTPEEVQALHEKQMPYLEWLYQQGEQFMRDGKGVRISNDNRMAAEYLGRKPAWLSGQVLGGMRDCPHCGETIKSSVTVCKYCRRDVEPVIIAAPSNPTMGRGKGRKPPAELEDDFEKAAAGILSKV